MTIYEKYFIPVYKRFDHEIIGGKGCFIFTKNGEYLDMFSGLGVNILGYGNQKVIKAVTEQFGRYSHISNYFESEPSGKLAEYLSKHTFAKKVFFTNSGTEAVEAGLKLIRKYGKQTGRKKMITFTKAFHGRTLGSSSVTAPDLSSDYNCSGIKDIVTLEFNNLYDLEKIDTGTAGVFIEAVQGQGGINAAGKEFMLTLRELTNKKKVILMADEIQSGMGRTGRLFAFENYGIEPDLAVIAKAIGGGLPLGALLAGGKWCDYLKAGEHGSTFGGNPVSCSAGLATIRQINKEDFLHRVNEKGKILTSALNKVKEDNPDKIGRITVIGLMAGIEILKGHDQIIRLFEEEKIFVNITQKNILRLLPPLIISEDEIEKFIFSFYNVLKKI
ncbi:MAG TPA: acetylornithine transaminase [Clostridiales bacterium]|nr:acetylornithine transaminase [Clostridiales bacterium]HQP69060.1 acetylornithine transaminase [Clostridiales bacterium]